MELVKLLVSPHPDYLRTAYETGITGEFLPEFDACMKTEQNTPHHCYTVGEHTLQSLLNVRADKVLRLTMLLHDMGKPVDVYKRQVYLFLCGIYMKKLSTNDATVNGITQNIKIPK